MREMLRAASEARRSSYELPEANLEYRRGNIHMEYIVTNTNKNENFVFY